MAGKFARYLMIIQVFLDQMPVIVLVAGRSCVLGARHG